MMIMSDMTLRFAALKQQHNVLKMVLSRIVLLLVEGEAAAAQQELDCAFSLEEFVDSNEAKAAGKLLAAYMSANEVEVQIHSGFSVALYARRPVKGYHQVDTNRLERKCERVSGRQ